MLKAEMMKRKARIINNLRHKHFYLEMDSVCEDLLQFSTSYNSIVLFLVCSTTILSQAVKLSKLFVLIKYVSVV